MISIIYWSLYLIGLIILVYLVYAYSKTKNNLSSFAFAITCVSLFLCLGPMHNILDDVHNLRVEKNMIEVLPQEEIIITNTNLPDDLYYLGCELVDYKGYINSQDEQYHYIYQFGTIDINGRSEIYEWDSTEVLSFDVPYLLVMDSMGTRLNYLDDEIITVWSNVQ